MGWSDTVRNGQLTNLGAYFNGGRMRFRTSADVLVVDCLFAATAFQAAAGGSMTSAAIGTGTSAAGGLIANAQFLDSSVVELKDPSVGESGDGTELEITNLLLAPGDRLEWQSGIVIQQAA